jgi:hypothetical protein
VADDERDDEDEFRLTVAFRFAVLLDDGGDVTLRSEELALLLEELTDERDVVRCRTAALSEAFDDDCDRVTALRVPEDDVRAPVTALRELVRDVGRIAESRVAVARPSLARVRLIV